MTFEEWSPCMTSDNTPSPYSCSASSNYGLNQSLGSNGTFAAFDGNSNTIWHSESENGNAWIKFDFGKPTTIAGIILFPRKQYPEQLCYTGDIQGSNDDSTYTNIVSFQSLPQISGNESITHSFDSPVTYRFYKIANMRSYYLYNGGYVSIGEIKFIKSKGDVNMSQKFKFHILTGSDCAEKYAAIATKDPFTFYLLQSGVGYLGNTLLFDAGTAKTVVEEIVPETATHDMLATTKAIVNYVTSKVADITVGDILTAKFFRNVEAWTLSTADMSNTKISKPSGCKAGDIGLMFTADINDEDDGNEQYYFVSLVDYLNSWYEFVDSDFIMFSVENGRKVKALLNIDDEYLKKTSSGLAVKATTTINTKAPQGELVTAAAVVDYIESYISPRLEKAEECTLS